eukprot:12399241-Karenia_brevis.AAC.1
MGTVGNSHWLHGKTELRTCMPLTNLNDLEVPTLQWARLAFEQGSFDWLRRIAIKNANFDLVPMLDGPGGYILADHLAAYDFDM